MLDRTRRPFNFDEATAVLARTPATLDALLRGLPDGWIDAHEGGESWSAFDVVGHLLHGERTDWMPRVKMILEHGDSKPFASFDRFAQFAESEGRTLGELLDEFREMRSRNLRELASLNLTDADLDRRGSHPSLGGVTLRNVLSTWVAHDLDHIIQICRVFGSQYADEVGPWRAYLRIISGKQG
jgi:hypothetical protein